MTDQTTTPEADLTVADIDARLRQMLNRTPQVRGFYFGSTTSTSALLDLVERTLTEDFGAIIRENTENVAAVVKLERERQTVREFFGVTA